MSLSSRARTNMVEGQLRPNRVIDPRLLDAVEELGREPFVPEAAQGLAYADAPIDLGGGRQLLEPTVLGRLLQEAEVRPEDIVLVVGAATGYGAALLARLAATVVALECDIPLALTATTNLQKAGAHNAAVITGPLLQGHAKGAPYNVILLEGAIAGPPPASLVAQLAEGGRLLAVERAAGQPGRAKLWLNQYGHCSSRILFDAQAAYLPGFAPEIGFIF